MADDAGVAVVAAGDRPWDAWHRGRRNCGQGLTWK